jgi:hypothetical protein
MLNVSRSFRLLRSCGPTGASLSEENCYQASIFRIARHPGAIRRIHMRQRQSKFLELSYAK